MSRLPTEAREALMRVWLDLLGERHPGLTWLPSQSEHEGSPETAVPLRREVPVLLN